jgi:putative ABC transport system ATP-binding protein
LVLLEVKNLTKNYDMHGSNEQIQVLKRINLSVNEGEFIAVMGPSGSGKSTLLNILSSIDTPSSGTIVIDAQEITKDTKKKQRVDNRRNKTSIVFQSFNLIEQLTALENVSIPLTLAGMKIEEANRLATDALKQLGLGHRINHLPEDLSGGERQRVAIARAIVTNPKVILADEPTGNLDSKTGQEMIQIFQELKKPPKLITTLMVTHDPDLAKKTDRIFILRNGELVEGNGK